MGFIAILFAALAVLLAAIYLLGLVASVVIGFSLRGKPNAKKWQSRGKYLVIIGIPLWVLCTFYFSFNPGDDYYLQRFSEVALRDTPKSARVVAKSPQLFGLHSGESCTYSRIVMSQQDYSSLYDSIDTDSRFIKGYKLTEQMSDGKLVTHEVDKVPYSEMRHEVAGIAGDMSQKSSYVRPDVAQPFNRQYALAFLSDGKHIEVHSCI
ncbi:MAG: hypothetical protein ACKVOO_00835 [Burkholderiaceae bacterium]